MLLVHYRRLVFCALVFVLFSWLTLSAQDSTAVALDSSLIDYSIMAKNTVYVEAAGNGGIYSVNYDRLVTRNISVRAGVSYYKTRFLDASSIYTSIYSITIPLSASYLFNFAGTPSNIELGIGSTIFITTILDEGIDNVSGANVSLSRTGYSAMCIPIIGYRLQPQLGGFNFRAIITPFIPITKSTVEPRNSVFSVFSGRFYWGLSFGYTF
jgi:hypothetical protein